MFSSRASGIRSSKTTSADYRAVFEMLRAKIKRCDAVICLIGRRYGEEPTNRAQDATRQSYTQIEFEIAKKLGKPIFTFIAEDCCVFDNPSDPPEDDERRTLQEAYLSRIAATDRLRYSFRSRENLLEQVRVIELPRRPRRVLRILALISLLTLLCVSGCFIYEWYTYDDPCAESNTPLIAIPEKKEGEVLSTFVPANRFVEDIDTRQAPINPDANDCHLKIINETGRPIRIWRYFPNPRGSAFRSEREAYEAYLVKRSADERGESNSQSDDPKSYRPWRDARACRKDNDKVQAIGGWSFVLVENLDESIKDARQRTSSPDDGGPYAWFKPVRVRWVYMPYGKDSLIKIKKGFFDDNPDSSEFSVTQQ